MGTRVFDIGPVPSKAAAVSSWLQCNPCGELPTVKTLPVKVLVFAAVRLRLLFSASDNIMERISTEIKLLVKNKMECCGMMCSS